MCQTAFDYHGFTTGQTQLRFPIGKRVEVKEARWWLPGRVVQHWFREAFWTADQRVPYQVRLDDGGLAWVGVDADYAIRARGDDSVGDDDEELQRALWLSVQMGQK